MLTNLVGPWKSVVAVGDHFKITRLVTMSSMRAVRQVDIEVTELTVADCSLFPWRHEAMQTVYRLTARAIGRRGGRFEVVSYLDDRRCLDQAMQLLYVKALFQASQQLEVQQVKARQLPVTPALVK